MSTSSPDPCLLLAEVCDTPLLFAQLGESEAGHAIERCLKRITRVVEIRRGEIVDRRPTSLAARFPTPDEARLGASEIHQRIAELPPVAGQSLRVRTSFDLPPSVPLAKSLHTPPDIANAAPAEKTAGATGALPRQSIGAQLRLRHRARIFVLDANSGPLHIGRSPDNTLVLDDRQVSRQHARIEQRPDGFYLVDSSTNGSFISADGQAEMMLRQHEMRLSGHGQLCFGRSGNDPHAPRTEYECT